MDHHRLTTHMYKIEYEYSSERCSFRKSPFPTIFDECSRTKGLFLFIAHQYRFWSFTAHIHTAPDDSANLSFLFIWASQNEAHTQYTYTYIHDDIHCYVTPYFIRSISLWFSLCAIWFTFTVNNTSDCAYFSPYLKVIRGTTLDQKCLLSDKQVNFH